MAARAEIGEGVKGVRASLRQLFSFILYEATIVRGPQIIMDGPDFTALGFRGMGRIGPRSSLTGRAKRGIFGLFLFLVQIYVF